MFATLGEQLISVRIVSEFGNAASSVADIWPSQPDKRHLCIIQCRRRRHMLAQSMDDATHFKMKGDHRWDSPGRGRSLFSSPTPIPLLSELHIFHTCCNHGLGGRNRWLCPNHKFTDHRPPLPTL
jgi:hypothetical protein